MRRRSLREYIFMCVHKTPERSAVGGRRRLNWRLEIFRGGLKSPFRTFVGTPGGKREGNTSRPLEFLSSPRDHSAWCLLVRAVRCSFERNELKRGWDPSVPYRLFRGISRPRVHASLFRCAKSKPIVGPDLILEFIRPGPWKMQRVSVE